MDALFRQHALELDAEHETHERLVKVSRDITVASKRFIFQLLRPQHKEDAAAAAEKAFIQFNEVCRLWRACDAELSDETEFWRHRRALSAGAQEFTEAALLLSYLHGDSMVMMGRAEIEGKVHACSAPHFRLCAEDYLLGVLDATGEVMRAGMNSLADGDVSECERALSFVRAVARFFQAAAPTTLRALGRDAEHKLETLESSVQKLEKALFRARIRKAEHIAPPKA